MAEVQPNPYRHYFVDEAGDSTIFDRDGRIIVGKGGCSSHFLLGMLDIPDLAPLSGELDALRRDLVASAFFRNVPSLQPVERKTALLFHAKDDLPEVRWEVFQVLARHPVKFFCVVRDKLGLSQDVLNKNRSSKTYRYRPNDLYDQMVRRLFKDRLHKDDGYRVCFATRGSSDRTAALRSALESARENFRLKWGIASDAPIEVSARPSHESAGLQAVDYFLWAVQRVYTKREDRYVTFLNDRISLVHDVDDRRKNAFGVYYTRDRPLSAEAIPKKTPGI